MKFINTIKTNLLIICLLLASLSLTGCNSNNAVSKTGLYFDTVITITLYDNDYEKYIDECFEIADKYDTLLSITNPQSEIYKINHRCPSETEIIVSEDIFNMLEMSLEYSEITNGALDPTIEGVSCLWDFTDNTGKILPEEDIIQSALEHTGYKKIHLNKEKSAIQFDDPQTQISLGFVAKGYIADKMKEHLEESGIEHALINLGGNILCIGQKPDGSDYNIGLQYPFKENGSAIEYVKLNNNSAVSSGIYQRYFEKDNTIYHHILDTKTGYPIRNNLLGVTIIGDSSTLCDILSTSCMVLGYEDGINLINNTKNYEAYFITDDYKVTFTGLQ